MSGWLLLQKYYQKKKRKCNKQKLLFLFTSNQPCSITKSDKNKKTKLIPSDFLTSHHTTPHHHNLPTHITTHSLTHSLIELRSVALTLFDQFYMANSMQIPKFHVTRVVVAAANSYIAHMLLCVHRETDRQ